jgi:uncharacterized protein (TIRG00374 family)
LKRLKKLAIGLVKIGLSAAILAALVWLAWRQEPEAVESLRSGQKNWSLLFAALACCLAAVVLTFVRWWFLIRTLGLPLRIGEALRIGFVGFLFNLAPMGIVGGDLLKAWMLARHQKGRGVESFATVVVDRIIGMYALFTLAAAAIVASGLWHAGNANIRALSWVALAFFAVCTLVVVVLIGPEAAGGRLAGALGRIPRIGRALEKVAREIRMYRHHRARLAAAWVTSVAIHTLFVFAVHFIALSLPGRSLSLPQHFVVVPLAGATNAFPLPAGPQEGAYQVLYGELVRAPLKGLVVALVYRLTTLLIAAVGIVYYFASRREVFEVLHEHEEEGASGVARP